MRVPPLLALLLLAAACATDGGHGASVGTSDTGSRIALIAEDAPPSVVRPPARREPVEVSQAEYQTAMKRFAQALRDRLPSRLEKRLDVVSWHSPEQRDERAELVAEYSQWCAARSTPGDCLGLLQDGLYLTEEDKRTLAFALATRGVWDGTAAVLDEVLDPVQLQIALLSTITMTLALLSIPEPISKVIVIVMTASLVGYVGWDTLVGLIEGWRRLEQECQRARTFAELRDAGDRYERIMGEKVTRLLILAATAALASGGGNSINGGLPGLPQASRFATAEGFAFRVVGQTRSIKVTGRILTVSMETNALLMANQGMSSGNGSGSGSSPPVSAAPSSKYRLRSIESWRKPQVTEDGRIKPYKDTQKPWRLLENKGKDRAGKTITDDQSTIRFDKNGFPEFNTRFETILEDVHIGSGNPRAHRMACNEKLFRSIQRDPSLAKDLGLSAEAVKALPRSSAPPPGYIWHHHQDVGRMQLVPLSEHKLAISHTGGMAIWGGGYP
jgi:hypothetical protein